MGFLSFNSLGLSKEFTFLFLGDLHYNPPQYATSRIVEAIATDIKNKGYQIDFICHTGDLVEIQEDYRPLSVAKGREQWEFALKHVKKIFNLPFFMCPGNHDWYGNTWFGGKQNIEEMFLPFISRELGRDINKPFYSFRWSNSYFIFLNHYGFDKGWDIEQERFLEKSLSYAEESPFIKHVFIFGHPYLWNLDHFRFNEHYIYLKKISKYKKVDAYFCGHTHHNTASVWNFGKDRKFIQISASPLGHDKELIIPEEGEKRLVLNPPPSRRGYLRRYGPANGYFLVTVNNNRVTVGFDIIGGERVWEFYWTKPGEIIEIKAPAESKKSFLRQEDIGTITEAKLYLFPYTPEVFLPRKNELKLFFNGKEIGILPRATNWGGWGGTVFVNVPPSLIKMKNKIVIPNPFGEAFGLKDLCLWVRLKDGREVLTEVYPYVLFSVPWKQIYMDFGLSHPTCGVLGSSIEENVPEELIRSVKPGQPVSFELEFRVRR